MRKLFNSMMTATKEINYVINSTDTTVDDINQAVHGILGKFLHTLPHVREDILNSMT